MRRSASTTGSSATTTLSLRDYPTLASVIGFVRERATGLPARAASPAPVADSRSRPRLPGDGVEDVVLGIVAEQTGYPSDMLDLDLDLEADLGIDTVKQAETFAAIREHYEIERDDNLSLRDYPTLASVIGFVHDRATNLAGGARRTRRRADRAAAPRGGRRRRRGGRGDPAPHPDARTPARPRVCVPTGVEIGDGDR